MERASRLFKAKVRHDVDESIPVIPAPPIPGNSWKAPTSKVVLEEEAGTGCTVVICETGATAGIDVRDGAP